MMNRGLSMEFINNLKNGLLHPILELILDDNTLIMEIRNNYINIYYRGGNLLKIEEKDTNIYSAYFDMNYLSPKIVQPSLPSLLNSKDVVNKWLNNIPYLKHQMDLCFSKHSANEREVQQQLVRENNFNKSAKGTDYFICDIEYRDKSTGQFDAIAVHWPSSSSSRKKNENLGIAFIEIKYMDSALRGSSGIQKHFDDLNKFLSNKSNLEKIKEELKVIFKQKIELGLIDNQHYIGSFSDNMPEYIFIFANHDPDSTILRDELNKVKQKLDNCNFDFRIAVSTFMGYGLYQENIYELDEFFNKFDVLI